LENESNKENEEQNKFMISILDITDECLGNKKGSVIFFSCPLSLSGRDFMQAMLPIVTR
jgi:hypothetical protein